MAERPRWLVLGIGNPSRGDDALGALFIERLGEWLEQDGIAQSLPMDVVLETDFQCQIEHAMDLKDVQAAVFVDASHDAPPPFTLTPLQPHHDPAHTTHSLPPAAVMAVAQRIGLALPPCWLLAIRGEAFQLGEAMSAGAESSLQAALLHVQNVLRRKSF